jgi:hypothetical protein
MLLLYLLTGHLKVEVVEELPCKHHHHRCLIDLSRMMPRESETVQRGNLDHRTKEEEEGVKS